MDLSQEQIVEKFGREFVATPDTFHMGIHRLFGKHVGKRFAGHKKVLDACVGGGFTSVCLARYADEVLAVDVRKEHLDLAEQNGKIAGLENIKFIFGDVMELARSGTFAGIDAAFFDPDWALPGESKEIHTGMLNDTSPQVLDFIKEISHITKNIAIRLPKETKLSEFDLLPLHELEEDRMGGKLKFYIAYLGDLIKAPGKTVFEV